MKFILILVLISQTTLTLAKKIGVRKNSVEEIELLGKKLKELQCPKELIEQEAINDFIYTKLVFTVMLNRGGKHLEEDVFKNISLFVTNLNSLKDKKVRIFSKLKLEQILEILKKAKDFLKDKLLKKKEV